MIRGIGPVYAKKMVKAFGEKVFDIIEAEPARLREVTGIGAVRAKRITDAWAEQKVVREIMVFLHSNGVGTARAVRIYKTYGADAVQVMSENPYRLARDIRGIGFKTADAIAMKVGIEKTAMNRLRAGISYALTEATDEGHCGLPTDKSIPLAEELLEAPKELILTALELELSEGNVIADKGWGNRLHFSYGSYRAEQSIVNSILRILADLECDVVGDIRAPRPETGAGAVAVPFGPEVGRRHVGRREPDDHVAAALAFSQTDLIAGSVILGGAGSGGIQTISEGNSYAFPFAGSAPPRVGSGVENQAR
jgi:Holliday junction resolvasome RuvABC DNA-binding subunit